MNVLFLQLYSGKHPAQAEFERAINGRHPVTNYDPGKPLAEQFAGVDVVVDSGGAIGTEEMVSAAQEAGVKFWQVTTNGLDHIAYLSHLRKTDILVAHSPGPLSAIPLAEHALMLILCFAKNTHLNHAPAWQRHMNTELAGRVLGLIGFGASARELARRAGALGMRVMAVDVADIPSEILEEYKVEFFGDASQMDTILAQADYLSLHVPLMEDTRHLIDRRALNRMKPDSVLINVARGELVDEAALVEALQSGTIRGAGVDAYAEEPPGADFPLLQLENVIATPHVAGYTRNTWQRRSEAAVANIDRVAQGLPPMDLVPE